MYLLYLHGTQTSEVNNWLAKEFGGTYSFYCFEIELYLVDDLELDAVYGLSIVAERKFVSLDLCCYRRGGAGWGGGRGLRLLNPFFTNEGVFGISNEFPFAYILILKLPSVPNLPVWIFDAWI